MSLKALKTNKTFLQSNSLNSLNNQNHQGGDLKNKVLSATYGGTFTSISSNTTFIDVTFSKSVSIYGSGIPFIEIVNGQQGGGSLAAFQYDYASGANSKTLRFTHVHPSTPNNNGGASANVISVGADLVSGGTVVQPTGAITGAYMAVAYTTNSVSGTGAVFTAVIDGGQVLVELNASTAGSGYNVGDVFTFDSDVSRCRFNRWISCSRIC